MRIFLFIIIIIHFPVSAQYKIRTAETDFIRAGIFSLGGNLSFSSQKFETSEDTKTVLQFAPTFAYFITKNLSLGLAAQLTNISVSGYNDTEWGVGPSARYYFNVKRFAPFAGAGLSYGSVITGNNDKYTTSKIIITMGADYFLVRNVAAEMTINYLFVKEIYPERFTAILSTNEFNSRQAVIAFGINVFI
jgi:outer membrane protein W